jgi:hypothetical protein
MLNEDYRDMLHVLSDEKVKFPPVVAYALAAHGYPWATVDAAPSERGGCPSYHLTKKGG